VLKRAPEVIDRFTEVDGAGRTWNVTVLAPESPRLVIDRDLEHSPWLRERVGQRVVRHGTTRDEDARVRARFTSSHELKRIEKARKRRARSKTNSSDGAE
jgi:hypothetical protein